MIYRKWGRTVRWENGVVVHVEEAGEAREENGVFFAQPIEEREALPEVDSARVIATARAFGPAERILVTAGVALHECGGVRWREETQRVHVALVRKPWRVFVDDAAAVARAAGALARCEGEKDFERIRLAPHVAAAFEFECRYEQRAGGLDGCGRPIEHRRVEGDPPNVYRPSYRVRPVPRWLNVRAVPFGTIDWSAPEAIAVVDAPRPAVLVEDQGRVYIARLRLDRVMAAGEGGEMLL